MLRSNYFRSVRKEPNSSKTTIWMGNESACQLEPGFGLPCRVGVVLKRNLWSEQISGAAAVASDTVLHPLSSQDKYHLGSASLLHYWPATASAIFCTSAPSGSGVCSQKPIMSCSHSSCPTDSLKSAACWELQGWAVSRPMGLTPSSAEL